MNRAVWIGGAFVVAVAAALTLRTAMRSGADSALNAALAHLPAGFTATHGAVSYDALGGQSRVRDLAILRQGKVLATVGEADFSGVGGADTSGLPVRVDRAVLHDVQVGTNHVSRVDLSGLKPATLGQVLDPAAYPAGRPAWSDKRPVLDRLEAHDWSGTSTTPPRGRAPAMHVGFAMQRLEIDGIRLSQLAAPPDYGASAASISASFQLALAQQSSRIERMEIRGDTPQNLVLRVASGTGGPVDSGRFASAELSNFSAESERNFRVTIASASIRDVDSSRLLSRLPAMLADTGKPHPEILTDLHVGAVEFQGMRADIADGPLFGFDRLAFAHGVAAAPTIVSMQRLNLQTSGRPVSANTRAELDAFGMADFTADFEAASTLQAGTLDLSKLDIDLHDLAQFHLAAKIDNVPDFIGDPQTAKLAVPNTAFAGGSFSWDDHSLFRRSVKLAAFRQQTSPERLEAVLFVSLMSLHALVPDQPDAADQVGAFLQNPRTLTITLHPPAPVTLLQWQTTRSTARAALLGVHVTGD